MYLLTRCFLLSPQNLNAGSAALSPFPIPNPLPLSNYPQGSDLILQQILMVKERYLAIYPCLLEFSIRKKSWLRGKVLYLAILA